MAKRKTVKKTTRKQRTTTTSRRNKSATTKKSHDITTSTLYALSILGFLLSAFYLPQYSKGWAAGLALLSAIVFISVLVLMKKKGE